MAEIWLRTSWLQTVAKWNTGGKSYPTAVSFVARIGRKFFALFFKSIKAHRKRSLEFLTPSCIFKQGRILVEQYKKTGFFLTFYVDTTCMEPVRPLRFADPCAQFLTNCIVNHPVSRLQTVQVVGVTKLYCSAVVSCMFSLQRERGKPGEPRTLNCIETLCGTSRLDLGHCILRITEDML